ncbi:hypothetical protein ACOSP7_008161 [Xanthoceras sorbifolium]|uniref:Uncharacterized protein n=1 Tax=Xanthoceras sorbifolium TaxID=99658 RepID=A0ABQ8IBW8_9ROSI|nr:hypothetical protein JRO89_XS03G0256900 [Xanthoceras sorbifolium]
MATITLEELYTFHGIDREVFSRLVTNLARTPAESMLILATWLWLEERGYPNIILKMVLISNSMLNLLAKEASSCLHCLESNNPPSAAAVNGALIITAQLMNRNISLLMFYQNRFTAISGIKTILNSVCARALTDIIINAMGLRMQDVMLNEPLFVPGFPHPVFGDVTVVPRALNYNLLTVALWGWDPDSNVSEDDRTMFLTFSRGFLVTETEVRELFTRMYGDCVDNVHMQDNIGADEQPLFARLVLHSVATVDRILHGRRIAKFRINGKHIWARKYERRD